MTIRKLRALIEGLPPDSPVHRAQTDGHVWTWLEWLLWRSIRESHDDATRVSHSLSGGRSKPRLIKDSDWPRFPWVDPESKPQHYGDAGGRSGEEVVAFLDSFG